jgi:hypothetical protein
MLADADPSTFSTRLRSPIPAAEAATMCAAATHTGSRSTRCDPSSSWFAAASPSTATATALAGHLLDGRQRGPARGTDTPVVEGDDPMLGGDTVHDSGAQLSRTAARRVGKTTGTPGARAGLTLGGLHTAGVGGVPRRGLPRRVQSRTRGCVDVVIALELLSLGETRLG